MPFKVGENVGTYRVMEQLGQGGMATVFKAYHAALDRYVALKVLHPAFLGDGDFIARFQREARVVAKLDHPNIVPVYDFAEHDKHPYLVMKYVEGETLKARLRNGRLSNAEAVEIVRAVGAALTYAHAKGILHRDIKPSNVILANDGQVHLTDFGLARIAAAGESTISSDVMLGTPQYISPEQAMGKRDLDDGTDIYSFGVLVYELVVGRTPFSADTPFSVVHDHIYTPLPLPTSINPEVGMQVERVLLKTLAKERADRFESVADFVNAFERAMKGEEVVAADAIPESTITRRMPDEAAAPVVPPLDPDAGAPSVSSGSSASAAPVKKRRRWRWWYLIPIGAVLCACGFFGLVVLGGLSEENQPEQVEPTRPPVVDAPPDDRPDNPPPDGEPQDILEDQFYQEQLDDALANLEENPEDPGAYLWAAVAFIDVGDEQSATEIFEQGAVLFGEDPGYFFGAGDLLLDRYYGIPALEMYGRGVESSGGDRLPPELRDRIQQALYFAAEDDNAPAFFENLDLQPGPEQPVPANMLDAIAARVTLYFDTPEAANAEIDEVLQRDGNLPVARLVKAEILLNLGAIGEAEEILQRLLGGPSMQSWIRSEAEFFLSILDQY
ncbi:MAG: serine/threonine protein kinase [Chloroflexi bacterium]|nr:MAG: serine/threonine protein kinase [Chloroflexota bacterium]MBL1196198.1 serine/threonine protein kinase [Chloroflexota bacterium]NOH13491.1 serine/threonine protein kinase [Chloroflexota bacterium]